jgi:hypothetical protein
MTLVFSAALTKSTYLRGEPVYLILKLSNPEDRPVGLPGDGRCAYSLTPPGSDSSLDEERPAPLYPPEGLARPLRSGESWEGVTKLDQLFPLNAEGPYKVSARLTWGDSEFDSGPGEFRLEDLDVDQLSAGAAGKPEFGNARFLFVRKKDSGKALMYLSASLSGGPDAEVKLSSPHEMMAIPAEATDPAATSTTAATLLYWNCWRAGNTLHLTRSASSTVRQFKLPGSVQRLIDPALLDPDSITHVYALTNQDGACKLLVVRVMDYLKDPKDPDRLLAERVLEAPPDGTAAMIDEVGGKARRALVLARMAGPAPRFDWMSYAGDAVPDKLRSYAWTKMIAAERIADSRPAITGLREGGLRWAWIVREAGKPNQALLCEVSFDQSGALQNESTTPLMTESPVKAARIVYLEGVPLVALWTEDGKVLSGKPSALRTVVPKSLGRVPPTFLVLRSTPCLLEFDAVKGIVLVPAR